MTALQVLLSLAALALIITALATPYLNPSVGLLFIGMDDIIGNMREIVKNIKNGDKKQLFENMALLTASLLYITFLSTGHIEILATCMLLQILVNLGHAIQAFRRGDHLEGTCHFISSILLLFGVIPQIRVIAWKWQTHPKLEGELCRDERGFVYLKVDDQLLFELNKQFPGQSLPPYFGPKKAGAHVTVIPVGELPPGTPLPELGQKVPFNIASYDSLKPEGWNGVSNVSFLAIHAPALDTFRSNYHLPPKVHGTHDFHITFGVTYA